MPPPAPLPFPVPLLLLIVLPSVAVLIFARVLTNGCEILLLVLTVIDIPPWESATGDSFTSWPTTMVPVLSMITTLASFSALTLRSPNWAKATIGLSPAPFNSIFTVLPSTTAARRFRLELFIASTILFVVAKSILSVVSIRPLAVLISVGRGNSIIPPFVFCQN